MLTVAGYLAKIDVIFYGIIFIPAILMLCMAKKLQLPSVIKIFCAFVIYISLVQAKIAYMGYNGTFNHTMIKYFIPAEFFLLSLFTTLVITKKFVISIMAALFFAITVSFICFKVQFDTFPSIALIYEYAVLTVLSIECFRVYKKSAATWLRLSLLQGLLYYSVSGFILPLSFPKTPVEAIILLCLFGISSKVLFFIYQVQVLGVLWKKQ